MCMRYSPVALDIGMKSFLNSYYQYDAGYWACHVTFLQKISSNCIFDLLIGPKHQKSLKKLNSMGDMLGLLRDKLDTLASIINAYSFQEKKHPICCFSFSKWIKFAILTCLINYIITEVRVNTSNISLNISCQIADAL